MAKLTKKQRSEASKKAAATRKAQAAKEEAPADPRVTAAPNPVPPSSNDRRADDQAIIGHFVEVTGGKEKGAYGVAIEVTDADKNGEPELVVVRTRDNDSRRIEVKYEDLVPASSGRR